MCYTDLRLHERVVWAGPLCHTPPPPPSLILVVIAFALADDHIA